MKRMLVPALLLVLVTIVGADYVKLQPDPDTGEDAYTFQADPDSNHGNESQLYTGSPSGYAGCIFIDFTALDSYIGATCNDAFLWFYVETPADQDDTGLLLGAVDGDWQEATITWNNMPGVHDSESISYPTQGYNWWGINVQPIVADWLNGTYDNDGFCLYDNSGPSTEHANVFSSDFTGDPDIRPYLELFYTPASAVEEASWGAVKALD